MVWPAYRISRPPLLPVVNCNKNSQVRILLKLSSSRCGDCNLWQRSCSNAVFPAFVSVDPSQSRRGGDTSENQNTGQELRFLETGWILYLRTSYSETPFRYIYPHGILNNYSERCRRLKSWHPKRVRMRRTLSSHLAYVTPCRHGALTG